MTRRAVAVAALVLAAACPAAALADSTPPVIGLEVRGPLGQDGWYVGDVVLNWTASDPESPLQSTTGCELAARITADTPRRAWTCTATSDGGSSQRTAIVRLDRTPPAVAAPKVSRTADTAGWFNKPFDVTWAGTDPTSGIATCTALTYSGPDSATATASGTCRDRAGNVSAPVPLAFKYDATAPTLQAPAAERPPAASGWYRAPVEVTWNGSDAISGIESCTRTTYAGPDDGAAAPTGTCRDRAGNVSAPGPFGLRYDATAPALAGMEAISLRRGRVRLTWAATGADRVVVTRRPGRRGRRVSTVYDGVKGAVVDRGLRSGRRYRYTARALDVAGNAAEQRVSVVGGAATTARLIAPRHGSTLSSPPLLRWRAVPKATYYNVQLFRGKTKIRSSWPGLTQLQLDRSWRFGGHEQRLVPGLYRWYVWPAYGRRAERRFGRLAMRAAFRIR